MVEEAYGGQDFVGVMVWRFERDGSFTADPEGLALLDVEHGVEGQYSLQEGELRLNVRGGYGWIPVTAPSGVPRWSTAPSPTKSVNDRP